MHDRIAELAGLRTELETCQSGPRKDVSGQVQKEIDRVRGELSASADALEDRCKELMAKGQDVPAAESAVAARGIRTALGDDDPKPAKQARGKAAPSGKQTAVPAAPPEKA